MTESVSTDRPRSYPVARGLRVAGFVVLGVVGAAAFALAFGYFVKLLWNWLMPAIFGLGTITYWQAFGIVVLAKLIFGGIGGGGGRHGRTPRAWRDHGPSRGGNWRSFWNEEGKEAFRRYVERKRQGGPGGEPIDGGPSEA